jgi:hypothetical protein
LQPTFSDERERKLKMVTANRNALFPAAKPNPVLIRHATKEIRKNWSSGERLYRVLQAQRLQQKLWESLGVLDWANDC